MTTDLEITEVCVKVEYDGVWIEPVWLVGQRLEPQMALVLIERVICDVKQTCALEDFVGDPEDATSVVDEQVGRPGFDVRFRSEKFRRKIMRSLLKTFLQTWKIFEEVDCVEVGWKITLQVWFMLQKPFSGNQVNLTTSRRH